ncbi:MAG: hypothetical protein H6Q90_3696 [Deltaproteobacteria bacterium]|nr:hypothetical protein [Deltaproteobacteria bacterium]
MWWRRLRYMLLLAALCAVATCPAAKRSCTARNRSQEAEDLLGYLAERVEASIVATGRVPAVPAGPTPLPSCCEQGGTCSPDATLWATPGWQALGFSIDDDFRYTYSYVPDPSGRSAVVRAVGDLDCYGESSLYEVEVRIAPDGVQRTWTRKNPYE